MGLGDVLGYGVNVLLLGGLAWGLVDLVIRVAKEPKRKSRTSIFPLLPFPFMPSGEPREKPRRAPGGGRLALQPVPVKNRRTGR
jgi:hypothetical protein